MSLRFTVYKGEPILVANFYDDVCLSDLREWALRLPFYARMFNFEQIYHIVDISRARIDENALMTAFQQERGSWGLHDFKTAGGKQLTGWLVGDTEATSTVFHLIGKPELGGAYLPTLSKLGDALYAIHSEMIQSPLHAAHGV